MPLALIGIIPLSLGLIGGAAFIAAPATIGAISGAISVFFSAIATLPVAAAVGSFIIIIMAALAGLTFFIIMIVSGAFILPSTIETAKEEFISPYESEFFEFRKTVSQSKFNDPPAEVKYKITLSPKKNAVLIHPVISDKFSVSSAGNPSLISSCNFGDLPERINPSETVTLECTKTFDSSFEDTAIINTVTLNVEVEGKSKHKGIASATVIIGDPPGDCPSGWPIDPGEAPEAYISQGPTTDPNHSHYGDEAIDISVFEGRTVYATHEGYISRIYYESKGGKTIEIKGNCNGVEFTSKYLHLNSYLIDVGKTVTRGTIIAKSGNTGSNTTGAHLDYRFINLKMEPDWIPVDVRGCVGTRYDPCYKL